MTLCFLGIKQFSGKMYRKSRIWKCSLNDKGDHLCQQILWLPEFKKKNEGARKRNDELRPYVSAEYARLKVCNLSLHDLTIFSSFYPSTFAYCSFSSKIQFLHCLLSLLSPWGIPYEGYWTDVSRSQENPFPTLFLTTEA